MFAEFADTFNQLTKHQKAFPIFVEKFTNRMQRERLLAYKKKFPKRKSILEKAIQFDVNNNNIIYSRYSNMSNIWYDRYSTKKKDLKERLKELATKCTKEDIPITEEFQLMETVWESTYRSQGFGARKYAQMNAENMADHARYYEIPVEVRQSEKKLTNVTLCDFGIWAKTTREGWELIRHLPGPSTKEWVRMCWKRGVNPRVYNPFLPYGYEEQNGLDYFGGYK